MHDVVIARSKWVRRLLTNVDMGPPRLLNFKGNMCCLGFICKSYGVSDTVLDERTSPVVLDISNKKKLPDCLLTEDGMNSVITLKAMGLNDDPMPASQRERKLKALFKPHGINLIFEGKTR